jgi:Fe-S-cluster containining protein
VAEGIGNVTRQAADAFSYACVRCKRCCTGKRIQLNPYEVARLTSRLGISTAEFRERWTEDGLGTVLRRTDTEACSLLGEKGCTVHPDRPLVCRLYPLGRHITEHGEVRFSDVDLQPPPGGVFGQDGTISQYLVSQGAMPFIEAADEYFAWYCAAVGQLTDVSPSSDDADTASVTTDLLDMDQMVSDHCRSLGVPEPEDIEQRKRLHLNLLYRELEREETYHEE